MKRSVFGLLLVVGFFAACYGPPRVGQLPDRDAISAAEIAKTNAVTAYEAVQLLRPRFFMKRGAVQLTSINSGGGGGGRGGGVRSGPSPEQTDGPVVYLDQRPLGPTDRLREILASQVAEIRYLDPSEANLLYGAGLIRGVIHVRTKRVVDE